MGHLNYMHTVKFIMKTGLMTMHVKVFVTLGEASEKQKYTKN